MPADKPRLLVLRVSDSFAALWPTLARECDLVSNCARRPSAS